MRAVGIDLAGKATNPTGIALANERMEARKAFSDAEILSVVEEFNPDIIAIDAPLSLPKRGWWRSSDEQLLKEGFKPLPPAFPAMRLLVMRAQRLVAQLRKKWKVIEVFPRASEKILGLKKADVAAMLTRKRLSADEYDAVLAALTAKLHIKGWTRTVGSGGDDLIVLPLHVELKL